MPMERSYYFRQYDNNKNHIKFTYLTNVFWRLNTFQNNI